MFADQWKGFKRSWVQHTGMQLATLSVLAATYTIVSCVLASSINLNRILTHWGESVHMNAYLEEQASPEDVTKLEGALKAMKSFGQVTYVPKEKATELFKEQMKTYAPDLIEEDEFSNPFPASFQLSLVRAIGSRADYRKLEELAAKVSALPGIDDVSYGQGWVKNYSSFVSAAKSGGWIIVFILVCGSIFVIGNSVRASVAARREEIEILELVGATNSMIRAPYIFEGAMLGAFASLIALAVNFVLYMGELKILSSSFAFLRVTQHFSFLSPFLIVFLFIAGTGLGALGAFLTVRHLNDGWAASQRFEA